MILPLLSVFFLLIPLFLSYATTLFAQQLSLILLCAGTWASKERRRRLYIFSLLIPTFFFFLLPLLCLPLSLLRDRRPSRVYFFSPSASFPSPTLSLARVFACIKGRKRPPLYSLSSLPPCMHEHVRGRRRSSSCL